MTGLVEIIAPNALTVPSQPITAEMALALWLANYRSKNTRAAYAFEIEAFAKFFAGGDIPKAVKQLLSLEDGPANAVADAWRQHKIREMQSSSTINRSMAALNSFVKAARRVGATKLRLEAKGEPSVPYRDTRGPGAANVRRMIEAAGRQKNAAKAARDGAMLALLFHRGLRRGEVVSLNLSHVDLEAGTVSILGKGRTERTPLTIPPQICAALAAWLDHRGEAGPNDPLFIDLSSNSRSERISGCGIHHVVRKLGEEIGIRARPHGLRHSAITTALDAFGGDYRKVKGFSRHRNIATVEKYDDNREDHGGQVADALCAIVK